MDFLWYIFVENKQEGPFSAEELLRDPRVSANTYAWREGYAEWKQIKDIPELKLLFTKQSPTTEEIPDYDQEDNGLAKPGMDELAIDMHGMLPPYVYILLLVLAMLIYWMTTLQW